MSGITNTIHKYSKISPFYLYVNAFGNDSRNVYDVMDEYAAMAIKNPQKLNVSTKFFGTRLEPQIRGAIGNLGINNFTFGDFALGILEGISDELYEMVKGVHYKKIIGSGNGIRKNGLLRKILSEKFGFTLYIPLYEEEATLGAAFYSLYSTGKIKNLMEAQEAIQYEAFN